MGATAIGGGFCPAPLTCSDPGVSPIVEEVEVGEVAVGAVGDDRAGGTGQVTHDEIEVIAEELEGVEQEGVGAASSRAAALGLPVDSHL